MIVSEVVPRLDVLPPAQRRLWAELAATPERFILHGGTAIALQLGHRASIDFDFFCWSALDGRELLDSLPYLRGATGLETAPNTLTVSVDRDGPVKLSYFGTPRLGRVRPPSTCRGHPMRLASLIDLAGLKASVIQVRAEAKDYIDLHALLSAGVTLTEALAAGRVIYGSAFSPMGALKALTFYGDGDLGSVPAEVRSWLVSESARADPERLPDLSDIDHPREDS